MRGRYLFDASSIVALVVNRKVDLLIGNYTIELAGYEIGNYLWKEVYLNKSINLDDLPRLEEIFLKVLEEISVMKCWPPSAEVVKLAEKLNLTYYDAAYLNQAKKLGLTLITEDNELKERAEKVTKVMKTDNIIQPSSLRTQADKGY